MSVVEGMLGYDYMMPAIVMIAIGQNQVKLFVVTSPMCCVGLEDSD